MATPGGALVISLDFELHWGMRDMYAVKDAYAQNFLGARRVIPMMLDLFAKHGIAATWGTVGMLFAESKDELQSFLPRNRPDYSDPNLNPYLQEVGTDETDDPYHYAPSLIRLIASYPRQEIGSHTFSHYYCDEPGQDAAAFHSDVESAINIAKAHGYVLRSMILPRNQVRAEYLPALSDVGMTCYRGNQKMSFSPRNGFIPYDSVVRILRYTNSLTRPHLYTHKWRDLAWNCEPGPTNIPQSMALFEARGGAPTGYNALHLLRIVRNMSFAARRSRVFHLWGHPHVLGANPDWSVQMLERLLLHFHRLRADHGFESMNMSEARDTVQRVRM